MMLGPNLHQGNGKSFSTRFAFFFFFNSHLEFLSRKKVRSSEKKSVFRTPARLLLLFAAAAAENADDNDERWRKVLHCIIAAAESELFLLPRPQVSSRQSFSVLSDSKVFFNESRSLLNAECGVFTVQQSFAIFWTLSRAVEKRQNR